MEVGLREQGFVIPLTIIDELYSPYWVVALFCRLTVKYEEFKGEQFTESEATVQVGIPISKVAGK